MYNLISYLLNRSSLRTKTLTDGKSELDKNVDLSLCGLAPTQSQMHLFLDTLCARNKQRSAYFNQSEEAMSRVTASVMFFSGTGILKKDLFVTVLGSPPMP